MWPLYTRKVTCLLLPIIGRILWQNYLKNLSLNIFIITSKTTTCFHLCSQASSQLTQLLTNLHKYTTYSLKHLLLVKRYGLSSLTSAKLLIMNGTKDLFTNLKLLKVSNGFKTTSQDAVSVQCFQVVSQNIFALKLERHNALYLALFCFYCILYHDFAAFPLV